MQIKLTMPKDFYSIINALQGFWFKKGCSILTPYNSEIGAGTFHPSTFLRSLDKEPWNAAYVQGCSRPSDGRYGQNPNRLQHYFQFQVIMKPAPNNIQDIYLESLKAIGLDVTKHDIRFVEDDWESPSIGAWGLGWEVWCDGMEITQFTYFQQVGGEECFETPIEITYGLERIAMYILGIERVYDLPWNIETGVTYGDIYLNSEIDFSHQNFEVLDIDILKQEFINAEKTCNLLIAKDAVFAAYHHCIIASHKFNLLDSRGAISVSLRADYIERIAKLARGCAKLYKNNIEAKHA